MEFGPRALGNRSILGDPRSPKMQSVMNLKVKFRESFRPFAPVVMKEHASDYFDLHTDSPYMLLVAPVRAELRTRAKGEPSLLNLSDQPRSALPAVTHVDYSARIQTLRREQNSKFYAVLERFKQGEPTDEQLPIGSTVIRRIRPTKAILAEAERGLSLSRLWVMGRLGVGRAGVRGTRGRVSRGCHYSRRAGGVSRRTRRPGTPGRTRAGRSAAVTRRRRAARRRGRQRR